MCIFSAEVLRVSDTKILSTKLGQHRRGLVYQMKTSFENPTAMILPVPVKAGTSVNFFDWSKYYNFFDDLEKLFPRPTTRAMKSDSLSWDDKDSIEVVKVGAYIASFVPSKEDFERLDDCFKLSDSVFESLPYKEFAFVVAQLDPKESNKKIHPLAFTYDIANEDYLFVPTVHVHDNKEVDRYGDFDHEVYVQWECNLGGFEESPFQPDQYGSKLDVEKVVDLISPVLPICKNRYRGKLKNGDIVVKGNNADLEFFDKQNVDELFYGVKA